MAQMSQFFITNQRSLKSKSCAKKFSQDTGETQIQLQEIANTSDELQGPNTSNDISVEHDSGRRPGDLTDDQVNYLGRIGPMVHVNQSYQHVQRTLIWQRKVNSVRSHQFGIRKLL